MVKPLPIRAHHMRYFYHPTLHPNVVRKYGPDKIRGMVAYLRDLPPDTEVLITEEPDELCNICDIHDEHCDFPYEDRKAAEELGIEIGKTYILSKLLNRIKTRI